MCFRQTPKILSLLWDIVLLLCQPHLCKVSGFRNASCLKLGTLIAQRCSFFSSGWATYQNLPHAWKIGPAWKALPGLRRVPFQLEDCCFRFAHLRGLPSLACHLFGLQVPFYSGFPQLQVLLGNRQSFRPIYGTSALSTYGLRSHCTDGCRSISLEDNRNNPCRASKALQICAIACFVLLQCFLTFIGGRLQVAATDGLLDLLQLSFHAAYRP